MSDALSGISEDVRFDHAAAARLAQACDSAAGRVEGQNGSRAGWVTHALVDFVGHYSDVFRTNGQVRTGDASLLAARLREVAEGARQLSREARSEQQRRETARAWKKKHDERGLGDQLHDAIFGEDPLPVGPAAQPVSVQVTQPTNGNRTQPQGGGGAMAKSSARPENLRSFATNSAGADDEIRALPGQLRSEYATFTAGCGWGSLSADGVFTGFDHYLTSNGQDVSWARAVAAAFDRAGGSGAVKNVSDQTLAAALKAAAVPASRTALQIDPPQALGATPTTGYANDPVNTATGNFLEPELDLAFAGGCATLGFPRMYNSLDQRVGGFGVGWSSWAESGLAFDDDRVRWRQHDGREVHFPRLGDGFDRATTEAYWLQRTDEGYQVQNNAGGRWGFDAAGHASWHHRGGGTRVELERRGGRLVAMHHERGRSLAIEWHQERIVALLAGAGRRVEYHYDEQGRLVRVRGEGAAREYRWDDEGLLSQVLDADGVVEVGNRYDEQGRVVEQLSQHGRTSRFAYLPGNLTVVSDPDGGRANTWLHDTAGRLVGVLDAHDARTSFSYDAWGRPVLVTERNGDTTVMAQDERGRRVLEVLPSGARIATTWDELDRVTSVTVEHGQREQRQHDITRLDYDGEQRNPSLLHDASGGTTTMRWDGNVLVEVVDPEGVRLRFGHDAFGDLVSTTDADGNVARLERDELGRVVAAVTPSGHRTSYTYDEQGALATRTDPDGGVWRHEYTAAGRLRAVVDPLGHRSEVELDEHGEAGGAVDPLGRRTRRELDDLGNLARVELPDGSSWGYTHDALGRMVQATDPAGEVWRQEYDLNGELSAIWDPTGRGRTATGDANRLVVSAAGDPSASCTLETDQLGRVVAVTDPDGGTARTSHDACGRPVEHVDALGRTTRVQRDRAGRITRIEHPEGTATLVAWDRCGRLASVTDAVGATTTFGYDADGLLATETDPTGVVTTTEHDACGRLVARRAPGMGRSTWSYDAAGRVVASNDLLWGLRRFRWDAAGQLVAATDALGNTTRFEYDACGDLTAATDPLGNTTRVEHDACGRPVAQHDALGRTTTLAHDAAGRLVARRSADGQEVSWEYDALGEVAAIRADGRPVAEFTRDRAAATLRVSDHSSGHAQSHELSWDLVGRLVSRSRDGEAVRWEHGRGIELVQSPAGVVRREYDALGRLVALAVGDAEPVRLTRDAAGRVVAASDGTTTQQWVHRDGELVEHLLQAQGRTRRTVIERDEDGRIRAVEVDGERVEYHHDAAHQLVGLSGSCLAAEWSYDAAGRLVREARRQGDLEEVTSYRHDAAGQLLERRSERGSTRFGHDAQGRRTSEEGPDGRLEFSWGALGWLNGVQGPQGATSIHVDVLGELARVDDAQVFWDTANPWPVPLSVAGEAVGQAPGFLADGMRWQPTGWRSDRPLGLDPWLSAGATPSGVGGVRVGSDGQLVVAGLEWMGARAYDPATRGFLSTDPWDAVPGTSWWGNPYSFAGNDPLHALDPLGLRPVTDAELKAYQANHQGALAGAKHWMSENWEYVAGGAMVVAGGVLMATGVGGPVGMALVSAGADTILQKATTGKVEWGQVALSGGLALVGGGAATWAAKASTAGTAALRTQLLVNGGIGGVGSEATYLVQQVAHHERITVTGAVGNFVGGAIGAATGGVAGPAGGTVAKEVLKRSASGITSKVVASGINAAGASAGNLAQQLIVDPGKPVDLHAVGANALWGAGWQGLNSSPLATKRIPQTTGMTTLKQMSSFGPRTWHGITNWAATNTRGTLAAAFVGVGQNTAQGLVP